MMTYRQHSALYSAQMHLFPELLYHTGKNEWSCPSKSSDATYTVTWSYHNSPAHGRLIVYSCTCPAALGTYPCAHAAGLLLLTARIEGIPVETILPPKKGGEEPKHEDPVLYRITELLLEDIRKKA